MPDMTPSTLLIAVVAPRTGKIMIVYMSLEILLYKITA